MRPWATVWLTLLLLLLGIACPTVAISSPPLSPAPLPDIQVYPQELIRPEHVDPRLESLFFRESWKFSLETFEAVWQDLRRLVPHLQETFQRLHKREFSLADLGVLSGVLLVLLLLGSVRRSDRFFLNRLAPLLDLLPRTWPESLRHLARLLVAVLSRSLLFLAALFLTYLVWGAFSPRSPLFPALIQLLWIAVSYRTVHLLAHEILANPDNQLFDRDTRQVALRLYTRIRLFLRYAVLFLGGIAILEHLNYRSDLINFLYFVFSGCLLLFTAYLVANKAQIFALLPSIDEPIYQRFLQFLEQFYSWVMGFTLALGVLWVMGYHNLAHILFLRSWVLVSLFLAGALLHRALMNQIGPWTMSHGKSSPLNRQLSLALWLIEGLFLSQVCLSLFGIRESVFFWLSHPIATIGNNHLSVLSIFNGVLTLLIFVLSARILNTWLEERLFPELMLEGGVDQMITLSIFYSAVALGLLMGLNAMGLDLSMFAIFAGALAFGIGFGLQGIAKNFASGIVLIFTGLVKKGDYISVGEYTGYIQQVSWKKVHLRTPDHVDLIVPTVSLVESTIVNWTYSGREVRVHLPVRVALDSRAEQVRQALLEAAQAHSGILAEPAPTVWLKAFGESALEFELLVWIDTQQITFEQLRGEINFLILQALERYQIEIPFPQRDLHLRSGFSWQSSSQPVSQLQSNSTAAHSEA